MPSIPSCKLHWFLYLFFMYLFWWFISLSDTSCSTDYTMQMEYIYIAAIKSTLNSGDVNRAILCFLYVNALPSNLFCHQTSNFSISATCANQPSEYELNHLAYILMPSPSPWKRKKIEERLHESRFVKRKSNGWVELQSETNVMWGRMMAHMWCHPQELRQKDPHSNTSLCCIIRPPLKKVCMCCVHM